MMSAFSIDIWVNQFDRISFQRKKKFICFIIFSFKVYSPDKLYVFPMEEKVPLKWFNST